MAITNELRNEFYKILLKEQIADKPSEILSNPLFIEQKNTNLINSISGFTNLVIVDSIGYKDYEVVFYNALEGSVIGIFNDNDELIYQIDKHFTTNQEQNLYKFLGVKIDENTGQIYGINVVNNKTNFFLFNNIIEDVGIVPIQVLESQLFYSVLFNVEDEITGDVKIGNKLFGNIRTSQNTIYGFNLDTQFDFKYSFIINDIINKKIEFIQFTTDLGQTTPQEATWDYNEAISLSQGGTGSSTFEGISVLDILTGERSISSSEKSLGSIAISTQVDSEANVEVPFSFTITSSNPLTVSGFNESFDKRSNVISRKLKVADSNNFFNPWLTKIQKVIDTNPKSIDYNGDIEIKSKFQNDSNVYLNIDKNKIDKMLSSTKKDLYMYIEYRFNADQQNHYLLETIHYEIELDAENIIFSQSSKQFETQFKRIMTLRNVSYLGNNFSFLQYFLTFGNEEFIIKNSSISIDISEKINVNGKRLQSSLEANTTSQILIDKIDGKDDLIYKIVQEENNSYDGNSPVFLSSEKFYIPLKERSSNEFYLAEFNGETNRKTQTITRFYNDVGTKDYTDQGNDSYKQTLLSPKSIAKVLVNNVEITTSRYSLSGDIITMLGIKIDDIIIIEYLSQAGQPKRLHLDTTTSGEDVFIKGISDFSELGSLSRTIVGIGDDSFESTQSQIFGFNLYRSKSNIDYDTIAESTQPISNIKMKHIVMSRQKDMILWKGYNEDYSKVVKWIQIYPDSLNPYTYLPYNNPNRFFALERININKDDQLKNTRFDREFLDVANSGSLILANTIAEATDLNNEDNNKIKIYGATNRPLFEYERQIEKTRLENLSLNFQLTASVEDNLQQPIKDVLLSEEFVKLFTKKDSTIWNGFGIDKLIIVYNDSSELETDPLRYLRIDGNVVKFEISLLKISNKTPVRLILRLVNGSDIANIDLTDQACIGLLENLSFNIFLKDNKDIFPYMKYDDTPYDDRPYEPIQITNSSSNDE